MEIRSEPLLLNLDEVALGQDVAEAYRSLISDQIRLITEHVSAGTVRRRQAARRAFDAGASWAMERYSGGRIGPKPPNPQSVFKFNDSGRLAEGVFIRQNTKDKTFTVNLPTNRFNPAISGQATVMRWFEDLKRLVPALDPTKAAKTPAMQKAIENSIKAMVQKAESQLAAKRHAQTMAKYRALRAAAIGIAEVAT